MTDDSMPVYLRTIRELNIVSGLTPALAEFCSNWNWKKQTSKTCWLISYFKEKATQFCTLYNNKKNSKMQFIKTESS